MITVSTTLKVQFMVLVLRMLGSIYFHVVVRSLNLATDDLNEEVLALIKRLET